MKNTFKFIQVGHGTASGDVAFSVGMEAAKIAMKSIHSHPPTVALVFASVRYNLNELLSGIGSVVGNATIIGSTTAGEIYDKPLSGSVVVTILTSPFLRVRTGLGRNVSADWSMAVDEAVASSEIQPFFSGNDYDVWKEMTRDGKSIFSLLFSPGNTRYSDSRSFEILEKLKHLSNGRIPFVGGSSADDWKMASNYILCGQKAYPDSLLVAIFETSLRFGISMGHGFTPSERRAIATKVRDHEVVELDGKRASAVYTKWLGGNAETLKNKHLTFISGQPSGIRDILDQYRIVVASYFNPEGEVRFSQPLNKDTAITIMAAKPGDLVRAAQETLRKAIIQGKISQPAITIAFSCALRKSILKDDLAKEIDAMRLLLPDLSIVGFYSFGEQGILDSGVSCHGNEYIAVLVLGDELTESAQVAMENQRLLKMHRENETLLDAIVENIPDMIFLKKAEDLRYVRFNKAGEDLLGYSREEMIGKDDYDFFPPDQADFFTAKDRSVLKNKALLEIQEEEATTKYNGRRVVRTKKIPLLDEKGKPQYLLGISEDITAQKEAEGKRKKLEEQLTQAMEMAHLGHWEYDIAGDCFTFNDQFYKIFQTTALEVGGYRMSSSEYARRFVHPEDRYVVGEEIRKIIEASDPHFRRQLEHRILFPDGKSGYISVRFFIVKDARGKTVRTYGVNQDITKRKEAELALLASDQRLRLFIEHAPAALAMLDRELRYLSYSRRWLEDYKLGNGDFSGHSLFETFPETPDHRMIALKRAMNGEVITARYDRFELSEGSVLFFHWEVRPWRDQNGNIGGIVIFSEDVTELKQAEIEREKLHHQLIQAKKMEAVGRLAGGVAHDFNNMLNVIIGYADMARAEVDRASPLHEKLEQIRKAGERSADLTRQLLAFARKQTVSPKILDLNKTVGGMIKMLQRLIGEDIDLAWMPGREVWPVKMDPSQIDQILANLCINGRDAITDVGKIIIETATAEFDETYCSDHPGFIPGEYVLLAVSDNGRGMDTETLSSIFEPFFTTKETGQGTGLGLATVYGVVKQNDGFVNVHSEPDRGTTFKIYLPRCRTQTDMLQEKGKDRPTERGHETILLVEDELSILEMTAMMLERLGYRVVTATTPGEAIRLALEHAKEIHLLVTDVVMPEMNGRDLAKNILSIHPNIKCLFMSGYTANVIAHRGVLEEGVNFIQKPFSMEKLGAKAREVLDTDTA